MAFRFATRHKTLFASAIAGSGLALLAEQNQTTCEPAKNPALKAIPTHELLDEIKLRMNVPNYTQVKKDIAELMEKATDESYDDGSYGPLFVRLAWHCAGTYDKATNSGGSDGALMRFKPEADWGANAGLGIARSLLEPIKAKHPTISYADLYTLAGCVAIEELGGPKIVWRPGRTDRADGSTSPPDGRLPDGDGRSYGPDRPAPHLRDIFYRMGFDDKEIVILSGAHALGRCHTDRSGFKGPWTRAPTSFSNEYYRELSENTWTKKKWDGPPQYEDPTGDLMMLPTDMALMWDRSFRKYVYMYAKDNQLFMQDFAKTFQKLMELGVTHLQMYDDK